MREAIGTAEARVDGVVGLAGALADEEQPLKQRLLLQKEEAMRTCAAIMGATAILALPGAAKDTMMFLSPAGHIKEGDRIQITCNRALALSVEKTAQK